MVENLKVQNEHIIHCWPGQSESSTADVTTNESQCSAFTSWFLLGKGHTWVKESDKMESMLFIVRDYSLHRFYFIDSSGEDTNLQLYSLKQAKLYWAAIQRDLLDGDEVAYFRERCVFIICTIGLSVSQLLGQNNPSPRNVVPSPEQIFNRLVDIHNLDPALKVKFKRFITTYNYCRHFGLTDDGSRHWQVSQVTLDETREIYEIGLLFWEIVIDIYKRNPWNELDDLNLEEIENEP